MEPAMRRSRFVFALGLIAPALAAAAPHYAVTQRYAIGQAGGWDYLAYSADGHRLYISRSDRVLVVDADNGKVEATIPGTDGVHGIALVPALGHGYTSNGRADTLTEFDLATSKPLRTIAVEGKNPDALIYDAASKHLFAFDGHSNEANVIDPVAGKLVTKIPLPGKPEFAASDEAGNVYANIEDTAQLARIDSTTNKVMAVWKLAGCEEPSGLAIDIAHHRLFSVCQNKHMAVTDAQTGKSVATVAIGEGPDAAGFDATRGLVFSTNGHDGTLTVVHEDDPDHYSVIANVPTEKSARTLALDTQGNRLFTVAAKFGPRPAPTKENPHPWPAVVEGSFTVLVVGERKP
ncbi:MAG: YncE family protein [Proteobacteria bacterium]|nr:YncE family protein [Pseudomonadota bacterium]